jgi:hypothetical protein
MWLCGHGRAQAQVFFRSTLAIQPPAPYLPLLGVKSFDHE